MSTPNNNQNIIDSRDIINRIEELNEEIESLDEDELAELQALTALADEASDSPDWKYGATLVNDFYFVEFAQDEADSRYDIKFNQWPYTCIDWEQAAQELQQDYRQVDFDGETYWVRA